MYDIDSINWDDPDEAAYWDAQQAAEIRAEAAIERHYEGWDRIPDER
jgi:hypothetical protein